MGSKKVGNFGQKLEQKGLLLCSSGSKSKIFEVDKSRVKAFYVDDEEANQQIPKVLNQLDGKNNRIKDTVYACKLSQVNADGSTTPIESRPGMPGSSQQDKGLKYSDDLPKVVYVCKRNKFPEYQEKDMPDFPNMDACGRRLCGSRSSEALMNQFKMDSEPPPCYSRCVNRQQAQREWDKSIRIQELEKEEEGRRMDGAGDKYADKFTKWADREKYEEWAVRERKVWPEYCTGDSMGRASSYRQNKVLFNQAKKTLSSAASLRNQVLSRIDSDNGIVPDQRGMFGKSSGRCPHCGGTKDLGLTRTPVQIKSCNDVMPKKPAHLGNLHFEDDLDDVMYDDTAPSTQRFHFRCKFQQCNDYTD